MGDRVPILTVTGSLAPWVDIDLPIGTVTADSNLVRGFFALLAASTTGPVVVEIRDDSSQLWEWTIPQGDRSFQQDVSPAAGLSAEDDLFLRITDAGDGASNLSGWYELDLTAAAGAVTLTTLDLVKDYASEEGSDNDLLLLWIIAGVSSAIQTRLGRMIVSESITGEKYSGRGRHALTLARYPVDDSSVSVTLDGTALASNEIDVEEAEGQVYYTPNGGAPDVWPEGFRNLEVDYTAGYLVVPPDLVLAATIQAAYSFKRTGAKGFRLGERSTVLGGETNTFLVDAWEPQADALLAFHRAPRRFL